MWTVTSHTIARRVFPIEPEPTSEPTAKGERPRYRDPPVLAGERPVPWASRFEELTVTLEKDVVDFSYERSSTFVQHAALGISAFLFVVFVVSVMPLMGLSSVGNALWVIIGLVVLVIVGLLMQASVKTTRVRLDRVGVTIDQGTTIDHESIVILWSELAGVELEPVNEKDGRKGMRIRLQPQQGEPVDLFDGVGVGELNNVRRVILEALARHRLDASR